MKPSARPEENTAPRQPRSESTYKSGNVVQTNGATSSITARRIWIGLKYKNWIS